MCVAALVSSVGNTAHVLAASVWLAMYGLVTAVMILLLGRQITPKTLNYWEEALWVTKLSLGFWAIHQTWSRHGT